MLPVLCSTDRATWPFETLTHDYGGAYSVIIMKPYRASRAWPILAQGQTHWNTRYYRLRWKKHALFVHWQKT